MLSISQEEPCHPMFMLYLGYLSYIRVAKACNLMVKTNNNKKKIKKYVEQVGRLQMKDFPKT